ncbi:DUF1156 domain-containing protein [Cellulomonas sp. FA1]|uniref:DUF1156 domain-containing protein n=1 Tax=Cellulomonas sp. FA1 TaxID=1346710 RepID=UPI0006262A31|nr:DUF1156 domain-containing protein [Cellulomonas sp. FA1]
MTQRRKLIEVSLPLEDINRESAREKSIRHGHPSTLHLWWARRPLAAARAVLFAQLVDDPSSFPDRFPTEEEQKAERERLHDIIRRLVVWENVGDEGLLREAHEEILRSTDGKPPAILDPFAGGGTIPLEAQRLGLEAHASDLNPVAVLINKALIEIPPRFAGQPPVYPGAADSRLGAWPRATGLAEDVRRYGAWMRDRAQERIGHLYPVASVRATAHGADSAPVLQNANVVAWIWARTARCPNPVCGIAMPLVRSWWLRKTNGKNAYVVPTIVDDDSAPGGRRVRFEIGTDPTKAPSGSDDGTVSRTFAICIACSSPVPLTYVRAEGRAGRLGSELMAIVAEGQRQRVYLAPTETHREAANIARPDSTPVGSLPPHGLSPANPQTIRIYGFNEWVDLFTPRQLTALSALSDLVDEVRSRVIADGGSESYADAVATYLAFAVSGMTNLSSSMVSWASTGEFARGVFARQAIPMVWDYCETAPLGTATGGFIGQVEWAAKACAMVPSGAAGVVQQADAAARDYAGVLIATDPPYYDNIGYSDLSDYFYVWLRKALRRVYPDLLATILVPKAEELVANPHRHNGKQGAKEFFEEGFRQVFARARENATDDYPITVYYAFKQQELEAEGVASTGWSTMLEGMIRSGWTITATWPVRSERSGRMISVGANALASSIVLALRPRHVTAETTNRRGFLAALKAELPAALEEMRQGAIAPVDLAQATIGPGMAVFSRYARVVEADGSVMTVRTALQLINQALDEVLAEQDGDLDADTRFCLAWYAQYGWTRRPYGEADVLARAVNTSVGGMGRGGVLVSREGQVALRRPADLPASWNPEADDRISVWEVTCHLARALTTTGVEAAARLLAAVTRRGGIDADAVQRLSYRLYELAQHKHPEDAGLFNAVGTEWSALTEAARRAETQGDQGALGFDLGLDG